MTARTLVLIRHAKSDWSNDLPDDERPLAPRGRRQAPAIGPWLVEHDLVPDLAVVSIARRARETWEAVASGLGREVVARAEPAAYTFGGGALRRIARALDPGLGVVAVVGHNPAMEEVVEDLTGRWVAMPTAAIAVLDLPGGWGSESAQLRYAGRPADL